MKAEICIIGGGSAGVGAAYRILTSAEKPVSLILIEKDHRLGGTSTNGGVSNWEPGIGGPGLHHILARSLKPWEGGSAKTIHFWKPEEPYGLSAIDRSLPYERSLRRSGLSREDVVRFHFEPDAMARTMETVLRETAEGHSLIMRYSTAFLEAETRGRRIHRLRVFDGRTGEIETIEADIFIDASGDILVARSAGCGTAFGEESSAIYGETLAPAEPSEMVNGVSWIFRVGKVAGVSDDVPDDSDLPGWTLATGAPAWVVDRRGAALYHDAGGTLSVNSVPTMDGGEYFGLPEHERIRECRARMYHLWHKFRSQYGFEEYHLHSFAPTIGIRESYRLIGRYVLRQRDVQAGYLHQAHREQIVAFGDHALDIHGARNVKFQGFPEMEMPYGIPYDCLLPVELDNLLVACRGASFSHVAASSCRLSRTMMAMGEAAGTAAVSALETGGDVGGVEPKVIRERLGLPCFEEEIAERWGL